MNMNITTALGLTDSTVQVIFTVVIMIPCEILIYRGFSKE
jgi:ABC-type glycerol-3-phosphate transport system permease component